MSAVIITGSPPFGLFFSEMIMLRAGFAGSHVTATAVFLAALVALIAIRMPIAYAMILVGAGGIGLSSPSPRMIARTPLLHPHWGFR